MATIKSFTSLEQSKKLAEILPLESADMFHFIHEVNTVGFGYKKEAEEFYSKTEFEYLPCWSLAALLEQLDEEITDNNGNDYTLTILKEALQYQLYYHDSLGRAEGIETYYYDNMVDACYEMILKLHELKML